MYCILWIDCNVTVRAPLCTINFIQYMFFLFAPRSNTHFTQSNQFCRRFFSFCFSRSLAFPWFSYRFGFQQWMKKQFNNNNSFEWVKQNKRILFPSLNFFFSYIYFECETIYYVNVRFVKRIQCKIEFNKVQMKKKKHTRFIGFTRTRKSLRFFSPEIRFKCKFKHSMVNGSLCKDHRIFYWNYYLKIQQICSNKKKNWFKKNWQRTDWTEQGKELKNNNCTYPRIQCLNYTNQHIINV